MLERGKVYTQILTFCITPRKFAEIVRYVNKKSNTVAMALQQLQNYNFIKVNDHAYLTTPDGIRYGMKNTGDVEEDEGKVIRLISINLLYRKEFNSIFRIWIPFKQYFKPSEKVMEVEAIVGELYNLPFQNKKLVNFDAGPEAEQLIKRAYWISQKQIPRDHKETFDAHAERISDICARSVTPQELFRTMKFFSFPLGERVKRNLKGNRSVK